VARRSTSEEVVVKKMLALLFVGVVQSVFNVPASAQSCIGQASCAWYGPNSGCQPVLPQTAFACVQSGPGSETCKVKTNACAPLPESQSCTECGSPIDLAKGNTYIAQTDLRVPGLGGGLGLTRTWNSIAPASESASSQGMFGLKWSSAFEERLFVGSDGYMKYARGNGDVWSLGFSGQSNGTNFYAAAGPANQTETLNAGSANSTISFQNGEQRVFDSISGNLLSIIDRNGNATRLSYDASSRLVKVTDPASRHLYFSYAGSSNYLVTAVTSDTGLSLAYSYDNLGRLLHYTKPDGTTVSFQYSDANPALITAVLDSDGKILESHTYDTQGRGLTSSRAGGVQALTVTYPPSGQGLP
jgi:YD repeat-containing protein